MSTETKFVPVKLSAKCPEPACRKRLWLEEWGPACRNGHSIAIPLAHRTPAGTVSTKPGTKRSYAKDNTEATAKGKRK